MMRVPEDRVSLAHGAGGVETEELVEKLFTEVLPSRLWKIEGGVGLDAMDDAAAIPIPGGYMVVTIDSYTVKPLWFPGGNLGSLAASGTINDVLMMGGRPVAVMDSVVVEEGFPLSDLKRLVDSMIKILEEEDVALIGGDFKVMPKGSLDGVIMATMGIGVVRGKPIVDRDLRPGDRIIVSGPLGEHGAVITALQQGLGINEGELSSDAAPLTRLMIPLLDEYSGQIHAARDPTRGGLAMTLNDWARLSNTTIHVEENKIPLREPVKAYAEMLGIDPLALASEGVAVLGVEGSVAEEILDFIHGLGFRHASIVGEVRVDKGLEGLVVLETVAGGVRMLDPPRGELVPRIC